MGVQLGAFENFSLFHFAYIKAVCLFFCWKEIGHADFDVEVIQNYPDLFFSRPRIKLTARVPLEENALDPDNSEKYFQLKSECLPGTLWI